MISTQRNNRRAVTMQIAYAIFYKLKSLLVVKRVDLDITDIEGPQSVVDFHFHLLAIVAAKNRGLANRIRSEASSGPESHQAIKRNAEDSQVDLLIIDLCPMRQTTEGREPAEGRLIA